MLIFDGSAETSCKSGIEVSPLNTYISDYLLLLSVLIEVYQYFNN